MPDQKIQTFLMFTDRRAEEAMNFYVSLFEGSEVLMVDRYPEADENMAGLLVHAKARIAGEVYVFMDSPPVHDFTFTPSISLFVDCESPAEVDRLYEALSPDGAVMMELAEYPFSERYCWLADRYGVSWQLYTPPSSI